MLPERASALSKSVVYTGDGRSDAGREHVRFYAVDSVNFVLDVRKRRTARSAHLAKVRTRRSRLRQDNHHPLTHPSVKTPRFILSLSVALLGLAATRASAQTVITSAPYTISASGQYILGGNLAYSGAGATITISAPNVVLDLNNYFVAGPGNAAAALADANSVILVGNVANVKIKNGTVAGNTYGIRFTANSSTTTSRNYLLDNVTVTRCYYMGVRFTTGAPGTVIRDCSFSTIGGSTADTTVSTDAIYTLGTIRMERNNINGVTPTGSTNSYGINGYTGDFALNNTIANCSIGITSVTKYIGNLTSGVTTNFSGGTAVGDNN